MGCARDLLGGEAHEASLRKCWGAKEHMDIHLGMFRALHEEGTVCARKHRGKKDVFQGLIVLGMTRMQGA